MTIKINRNKVILRRENYFKSIVCLSIEDKMYIAKNKLSLTKIVREAIEYLRSIDLKEKSAKWREINWILFK